MTDGNVNFWILDCIVTNNVSTAGGTAMYGGSAARCIFADNRPSGNYSVFFSKVRLSGCLFSSKSGQNYGMVGVTNEFRDVKAIHCSSFSADKTALYSGDGAHSYLFNNLIVNNSNFGGNDSSRCASGNVLDESSYTDKGINKKGSAYIKGSAFYVDAPNGDMRITSGSDAIGAGTAWTDLSTGERIDIGTAWTNYYSLLHHDFNGDGLFFVNGNPTAGAWQKPSKYVMFTSVNKPAGISFSLPATNMFDFGETVEISAGDGDRKVLGFVIDGEFHETTSYGFVAPTYPQGGVSSVRVVANTNWFVDANYGADSKKGWTEDVPLKTLAKAMEKAESGDIVIALPGTYCEGDMIQSEAVIKDSPSPSLASRVVVPAGVGLVSRYGAESAIIKGEHVEKTGYGAGAMRCVYLQKGAHLSGFTVTGGATHSTTSTSADDNNSGAGIFCAENASTQPVTLISDCIVSNNISYAGGGGAYRGAKVVRCRFFENRSKNEGGAVANCCIYECVFDRNCGPYGVSQPYEVRGCTFGAENKDWNGNSARCALRSDPYEAVWPVYNCLFLGGDRCPVKHVYNCIAPNDGFIYSERKTGVVHDNIRVAEVETDALYAPAYGSAAMNAANMEYVKDFEIDGDVYGNPRRSNGGMDIGAVETDWRPRYAAKLGGRISIPEISWEAVETPTSGVMLNDGNSMTVEWSFGGSFRRARGVVRFSVAEGAALKIVRNGSSTMSYGSGVGELRMVDVSELENLVLLAEGGSVEILGFDRQMPFSIIVR